MATLARCASRRTPTSGRCLRVVRQCRRRGLKPASHSRRRGHRDGLLRHCEGTGQALHEACRDAFSARDVAFTGDRRGIWSLQAVGAPAMVPAAAATASHSPDHPLAACAPGPGCSPPVGASRRARSIGPSSVSWRAGSRIVRRAGAAARPGPGRAAYSKLLLEVATGIAPVQRCADRPRKRRPAEARVRSSSGLRNGPTAVSGRLWTSPAPPAVSPAAPRQPRLKHRHDGPAPHHRALYRHPLQPASVLDTPKCRVGRTPLPTTFPRCANSGSIPAHGHGKIRESQHSDGSRPFRATRSELPLCINCHLLTAVLSCGQDLDALRMYHLRAFQRSTLSGSF